jgi:hypothetical protein
MAVHVFHLVDATGDWVWWVHALGEMESVNLGEASK